MSTPRRLKVHINIMAQKNRNKKFQKRIQKFFSKKFFWTQNLRKTYFWPISVKNFINLVSLQSSTGVGMRAIAQNDRNTILLKYAKIFFKISLLKNSKNRFFGQKMTKKWQKSKIFRKIFFGRNRFRMVRNVF